MGESVKTEFTQAIPDDDWEYPYIFRQVMDGIAQALEKTHNIQVSDSFIVIMAKLVTLNPENKFMLKQPSATPEATEMIRLRQATVEFIAGMTSVQRNTIRMQLHYRGNHFSRAKLIDAHQMELNKQVDDLIQELRQNIPKHYKQMEIYYRKLVAVILTKIEMGSSGDTHVVKDTEMALASVFPKEEINLLANLTPADREKEINHLIKMTAGIRLYNRDLDPAAHGAGIEDVPTILPDKIYRCATVLSELRERNIHRVIQYTMLVQPYFMTINPTSLVGRRDISHDMLLIRQGLVMVHQILVYIKELSDELTIEDSVCDKYVKSFNLTMAELKEVVRDNATIPTFIVYPKFISLAESWRKLQDSMSFMDTLLELITSLIEYSENDFQLLDPLVDDLTGSLRIPDEDTFFEFPREDIPDDPYAYALRSDFMQHMDPLTMQYSGFCVWSLVKGLGLVLLANPNLGVFTWRSKQFLMANVAAAEEFRREPDTFMYKAIFVARRWPELIFLLKMENQVFNPDTPILDEDSPETGMAARVNQDTGVQTELHPMESNIVQGYTWNEWEYRRRAVILSKLYKCATHSTQTYITMLRKHVPTQTYPLKNTKMQTMHHVASEIPMSQFYFWGLRGCHKHPPHIVELSRDEPLGLRCFVSMPKPPKKKPPCI